jgi:hypothetical protein
MTIAAVTAEDDFLNPSLLSTVWRKKKMPAGEFPGGHGGDREYQS